MMPRMWMLMAQNIMSAITTACFSLSRGEGKRAPVERSGACLALSQARSMREGETARGRYAKPHFHHPLAYLLVVQAMGVFHQVRQRRVGFGFLRSPQRSAVGGTRCTMAPVVKKLRQVDVVATPDVPLPAALARAAALPLEKMTGGGQRENQHRAFWHDQFAKTSDVRRWLYWYHENQSEGNLSLADISWVLEAEGGETTLLKREGGSASGEREKWYIRAGNHVTLAELFNYGCRLCSCHFLYTLYLAQPVFVAKKRHSESKTPEAMLMRSAHRLRHHETGKRALPWNPW